MDVIINNTDRILVVAPHADDESIGCGGFLSKYGEQCDLLLLTDGRNGHTTEEYSDSQKLIEIRREEFLNVAKIANVSNVIFLNIEDGKLIANKPRVYAFNIIEYDYIFVPNRFESHPDHSVVLSLIKHMKKRQHAKAKIFEYEVWTPLRYPTWYLDISDEVDKKKIMIQQHCSQLVDIGYDEKGVALSCYRGMFINTKYAEAFAYSGFGGVRRMVYQVMPKKAKDFVKTIIGSVKCNKKT